MSVWNGTSLHQKDVFCEVEWVHGMFTEHILLGKNVTKNLEKCQIKCSVLGKNKTRKFAFLLDDACFKLIRNTATVTGVGVMKIPSQLVKFPLYGLKVQQVLTKSQALCFFKKHIPTVMLNLC